MPDPVFEWTDELTEYALRNCVHATWATGNPGDMLRVVRRIQENGGLIKEEEKIQLQVILVWTETTSYTF